MGKKLRILKGGRTRKTEAVREPSGKISRTACDLGTDQLRLKKMVIAQSERHELTPLGIMAGRGIITAAQLEAAGRFRSLRFQVITGAPQLGAGVLSKFRSALTVDDIMRAIARQEHIDAGHDLHESARKRFDNIRGGLTLAQWEMIRSLVFEEEWGRYDGHLAEAIGEFDLRGEIRQNDERKEFFWLVHARGKKLAPSIRTRVNDIRAALDRLSPKERKWSDLSEAQRSAMLEFEKITKPVQLDENDLACMAKIMYRPKQLNQNCVRI